MMYRVLQAPGWHGDPDDPLLMETEDEREAAMRAGCRADINMPGQCNQHDAYAVDEDGNEVDRIESFRCGECGEIIEWGDNGPQAGVDGELIDGGSVEKHLVTWLCDSCAESYEEEDGD